MASGGDDVLKPPASSGIKGGNKITWPPKASIIPPWPIKLWPGAATPDTVYKVGVELGKGEFAIVTKVTTPDGKTWARKLIKEPRENYPRDKIAIIRETKIMKKLKNHTNILKLDHAYRYVDPEITYGSINLLVEVCKQDLHALMTEQRDDLLPAHHKDILLQLLNGLVYMHYKMIAHRDLKPQNILITAEGVLKIADFGSARDVTYPDPTNPTRKRRYTPACCTYRYAAPEIFCKAGDYGKEVDMFSFGVIGQQLLNDRSFLKLQQTKGDGVQTKKLKQLVAVQKVCGNLPSNIVNDLGFDLPPIEGTATWGINVIEDNVTANTFLGKCLHLDPLQRITAVQAINDDFFKTEPLPKRFKWGVEDV